MSCLQDFQVLKILKGSACSGGGFLPAGGASCTFLVNSQLIETHGGLTLKWSYNYSLDIDAIEISIFFLRFHLELWVFYQCNYLQNTILSNALHILPQRYLSCTWKSCVQGRMKSQSVMRKLKSSKLLFKRQVEECHILQMGKHCSAEPS